MAAQRELFAGIDLQVCCLGQSPESRGGVTLPQCRLIIVSMRDPDALSQDWTEVFGLVCRTLWSGHSVLIHCAAGRHRAALVVCLILALLQGVTLQESEDFMRGRRQVELSNWARSEGGAQACGRGPSGRCEALVYQWHTQCSSGTWLRKAPTSICNFKSVPPCADIRRAQRGLRIVCAMRSLQMIVVKPWHGKGHCAMSASAVHRRVFGHSSVSQSVDFCCSPGRCTFCHSCLKRGATARIRAHPTR